ncbi:MAG: nitroreductase family protein, partial [Rhodobacteraceae bacterium]
MFAREKMSYAPIPLPDRQDLTPEQMADEARAFHDRMRTRHTTRDFTDTPIPRAIIADCIRTAGSAPSGANHQPWHFAAISEPALKARIREEAEIEERAFYAGGGGDEWIRALEPMGTTAAKPHLTVAPWLIVVFAQRWGEFDDGTRYKNYYVPESVGIATGFLIAA